MIPTPIQLARDLLAIHHHMTPDGGKEYVKVYKEDELIELLKNNYGFPEPDWEGNALEQVKFEARLRMEYLVSCPGDTIKECMEAEQMTVDKLADKLAWTLERTRRLLDGQAHINRYAAGKLEEIFRVDKQFWLNIQKNYITNLREAAKQEQAKNH